MSIREEIQKNEKIFPGTPSIKYYFKPTTNKELKTLLIGFSGFHGRENEGIGPQYNYVKHLRNIDVNQLYILDSNSNNIPLYYIGENGDNKYEEKVIQLILYIAKREEIPLSNIITFGSSKGGTAAAYFAMKYSLGNFIAGGMQTRAGDYLNRNSSFTKNIMLKTIVGEKNNQPAETLNERFMDIFNNPIENTNYYLHGGSGDFHFLNYVQPFHNLLQQKNISNIIDIANYNDHGKIGTYFLPFLVSTISKIYDIPIIKEVILKSYNESLILDIKIYNLVENMSFAVYVIGDQSSEVIQKIPYQSSTRFNITAKKGKYRFRVYAKKGLYKSRYNTGFIHHKLN